jgi:hypothetical protein
VLRISSKPELIRKKTCNHFLLYLSTKAFIRASIPSGEVYKNFGSSSHIIKIISTFSGFCLIAVVKASKAYFNYGDVKLSKRPYAVC